MFTLTPRFEKKVQNRPAISHSIAVGKNNGEIRILCICKLLIFTSWHDNKLTHKKTKLHLRFIGGPNIWLLC